MLVAILICSLAALGLGSAWIKALDDQEYKDDADFCYNCPRGWCELLPGEEGCERRKDDET